ncbi:MAG: DUF86 domain-containing protein [Limnochordia bacterium]|jgi:uncharacterized protein YutE (UPF0331/DUF86 family)|nr:DUF86 domain-containing protein [Limnochordia bacterium]MDD2630530.1 DUF86 domain-containing protein [Limnochordia bacterium]MDD4518905.1 DUF86 domain-containing protein [Limnochordia bacterium]
MHNNEAICSKLEVLLEYYQELDGMTDEVSLEQYKKQIVLKRAIEREIQLIVECATDINNMILKHLGKGPPKDYFNSFIDLAEVGAIDVQFALEIAASTGLRNILVHEYQTIDDDIVYSAITAVKTQYLRYISEVSSYLGCR